jgi:signal transduction histidine kinase
MCAVVLAGLSLVFLDARAVRQDLQRMFEELSEVALARSLVDDLRGLEQWVEAVPEARPATHALVFEDLEHHLNAARATLARFEISDDPSAPAHLVDELGLQQRIEDSLQAIHAALGTDRSIGELSGPLDVAMQSANVLSHTVEEESRGIGALLDRRSADLVEFMMLLGIASIATVAGLVWLLHRRVLLPVRELRAGTVALGRGEDVRLPARHRDELGDLAQTFAAMAHQLQESRRDLERRVEERTREVLRNAQLAQLGTLAAGVAHEINNPLASIATCAEGLLRDPAANGDDARLREYLQIIKREAMRTRDITTRLLRFAHPGVDGTETVWLGTEIHEVAPLFVHQMADAGVQLVIEAPPREPAIQGDPSAWRQVLFNLLRNALDASPRAGRIRVACRAANGQVTLEIEDDGPGIPEANRDRVFEPFFTTKGPGHGTGLGLAIVHRIVAAHGGTITIATSASGGARIVVTVPAARDPVRAG